MFIHTLVKKETGEELFTGRDLTDKEISEKLDSLGLNQSEVVHKKEGPFVFEPKLYGLKDTKTNREGVGMCDPKSFFGGPPEGVVWDLVERQMRNIPEWIVMKPLSNFGTPKANYATEIYVGNLLGGSVPYEIEGDGGEGYPDFENCQEVKAEVNGVELYTYRKGDYDYLILEFDGGDYPSHYITLRQCHGAAPFQERE
tara:strand:- start:86 stop:682 length:597 start_codon:yes stop_codon:yes gene_type:complete